MEITFREIIPGHWVFDCSALRASISKKACADNYSRRRCLVCLDCKIGHVHAGGSIVRPPKRINRPSCGSALDDFGPIGDVIAERCVRCGTAAHRLLARVLCVSCYNRGREVLRGRNAKGNFPVKAGASLRWVTAIVGVDGDLDEAFYPYINRPGRQDFGGLPKIEQIERGYALVRAIAKGVDELRAMVQRVDPAAEIIDLDVGQTFLEMRMTSG